LNFHLTGIQFDCPIPGKALFIHPAQLLTFVNECYIMILTFYWPSWLVGMYLALKIQRNTGVDIE
jgi:hypothetical protein